MFCFLLGLTHCTCIVGDVQQRVERLESSQQSTESRTGLVEHKVHHLQGDYRRQMKTFHLHVE